MRKYRYLGQCVTLAIAALASAAPVMAQYAEGPEATPVLDFELGVALLSDYHDRGLSLSANRFAVQGDVTVTHQSGLYASVWGSNIAYNGGENIEVDAMIGYNHDFGPVTANVQFKQLIYPGAHARNFIELSSGLSTKVGPAEFSAIMIYTPKQKALGGQDDVYAQFGVEMPWHDTPLTLKASVGVEDGAFGNKKIDWLVGANYDLKGFDLGVAYVDSARTQGAAYSEPRAVFSLARKF
jgi:uncharacterized protein (TIGR02001 family)